MSSKAEVKKMNKTELLELALKMIDLCESNDIEWYEFDYAGDVDDDDNGWDDGAGFKYIKKEKKYEIYMSGGHQGWWNYVLTRQGVYTEDTYGLHKQEKDLWCCPNGTYLSLQDKDYKPREEEDNMWEMCNECFFNENDSDEDDSDSEEEEDLKCEYLGCESCDTYVHPFGCIRLCEEHGKGQCVGTCEQYSCDLCGE